MTAKHPAPFSSAILTTAHHLLHRHVDRLVVAQLDDPDWHAHPIRELTILDPFAGIGRVHQLQHRHGSVWLRTVGVELEHEWAAEHPRTICADATRLPLADRSVDAIVTSPAYGNRLADSYDGRDGSKRSTYRIALGRPLSVGSGAALHWGSEYRDLHRSAWAEACRVLKPGGLFVVNVSDHIRKGKRQAVARWHLQALQQLGLHLWQSVQVETPRMRHGANAELRVPFELVGELTKPGG
jgi:hypothetical protein